MNEDDRKDSSSTSATATPADRTEYVANFVSGAGEKVQGWEPIFPICSFDHRGEIECFGTGFFISVYGIFVTAAHIIQEILDEDYQQLTLDDGEPVAGLFILQFIPPNTMIRRKITMGTCHKKEDVAVGVVEQIQDKRTDQLLRNKIITLTTRMPNIGDEIWTWAYPNSIHEFDGKQGSIYIEPKLYAGVIEENFSEGKGWGGRCYQTNLGIEGSASGGPVFGSDGRAFALNSGAMAGTDLAYVSHLQSIGGLPLPNVQTNDGVVHDQITICQLIDDGAIRVDGH